MKKNKFYKLNKLFVLWALFFAACTEKPVEPVIELKLMSITPEVVETDFELSWEANYTETTIQYYEIDFYLSVNDTIDSNDMLIASVECAEPSTNFLFNKTGTVYFHYVFPNMNFDVDNDGIYATPVNVGFLKGDHFILGKATTLSFEGRDTLTSINKVPIRFK